MCMTIGCGISQLQPTRELLNPSKMIKVKIRCHIVLPDSRTSTVFYRFPGLAHLPIRPITVVLCVNAAECGDADRMTLAGESGLKTAVAMTCTVPRSKHTPSFFD